ncbi:glycosyltransferase [Cyanobium sp. BA20m-14]|uniref:glycosyltransferase n=1 Tax=Cyanobium sp. BA20m-14 TaxID=2823703 RepID=UPI0020CF14CB|nr:glycosyltransferase [Cyanobium sp. BA20m-14]MCP9913600.1 glycosyltransferase [Cyanobium sp. BA20m-14]
MNILFVHQNFPGQYKHLLPYCQAKGHTVLALGNERPESAFPKEFPYRRYTFDRSSGRDTDPLAIDFESKMIRARSCAAAALALRDGGFYPDVICAHTGWGEDLFLLDVWPKAKLIGYCEYYYNADGYDLGFDAEYGSADELTRQKLRSKNASILVSLQQVAVGVSPTRFQRNSYPLELQPRIRIIHDGIDTREAKPQKDLFLQVRGQKLTAADPVVTFVSRSLEPARGFHRFMRALPRFQELYPEAHVIIVGTPEGGYGARPEVPHKDQLLSELKGQINLDRIYFPGRLAYPDFLRLLAISRCHVYFTIPFVLSWSLLEGMAAGCVVVGSDTAPLREVIRHGENGLLVDYFDTEALAQQMHAVLRDPEAYAPLRKAARQTVLNHYDRVDCLARHHALIQDVAHGLV